MTEAIFGLVGVLLGGLLNGGVTWWSERTCDTRDARAAARLVEVELIQMRAHLEVAATVGVVGLLAVRTEPTAWENSAPVLARLPRRDRPLWGALIAAYTGYDAITQVGSDEARTPIDATLRAAVGGSQMQIRRALDALREVTGSPPLAELLPGHEEKAPVPVPATDCQESRPVPPC